ncbi:unnamed protein product, partial [Onchocerca flexuosa]|uniref:Succinate dehydrogenase cytochrome b560 subunit, mitochondrial n=1 Tax=Onchocerca flexuosa TaxID=387005 RepID=A0A183I6S7_9BILA
MGGVAEGGVHSAIRVHVELRIVRTCIEHIQLHLLTYVCEGEDVASIQECCILPYIVSKCPGIHHNYSILGEKMMEIEILLRKKVLRLLKTSVPKQSVKTPIQEWGWDYLLRQRALKRPISPHLSVYKPQLTWMVSGFHRMTGCAMA